MCVRGSREIDFPPHLALSLSRSLSRSLTLIQPHTRTDAKRYVLTKCFASEAELLPLKLKPLLFSVCVLLTKESGGTGWGGGELGGGGSGKVNLRVTKKLKRCQTFALSGIFENCSF